jgi:Fe(3+) dicitrate transport protein|tara:strand:+ start:433 stop:606 length:174 start_codon:yes stop_codon:yes gene_type:complete
VGASDTDLDPEISVNYELGARLRHGALNVEAIGFCSHYSNTGCSGNRRCLYYNEKNL